MVVEHRGYNRQAFDVSGEPGARDADESLETICCEVDAFLGKVFGRKLVERLDLDCVAGRPEREYVVAAELAGDVADELLWESGYECSLHGGWGARRLFTRGMSVGCVCVCGRLFELSIGEKADQFGLARLSAGA